MDKVVGQKLAPCLGENYLTLADAIQAHNQATIYLRSHLTTALHQAGIPSQIQAAIFDKAQLWYCFGQETHKVVTGNELDVVYQRFDPMSQCPSALDMGGTLRVLRIGGVSHDQGWANSAARNRNTAEDSWTWVDMQLDAPACFTTERVYTNRQANDSFAYYQEDFDNRNQHVSQWDPGMAFVTRLRAVFPGWCMYAKWGCIMTFHAF